MPAEDRDWLHPWLRINVLLRGMAQLFRDRDARPVLKVEINKAVATREKLKCHVCWN